MGKDLWVARLDISYATVQKIQHRHGLTADEVRHAVLCRDGLVYVWDDCPNRGLRAIIRTRIRDAETLVVLYPRDDAAEDTYWLGSAYHI